MATLVLITTHYRHLTANLKILEVEDKVHI
jgi:hypothetical protein